MIKVAVPVANLAFGTCVGPLLEDSRMNGSGYGKIRSALLGLGRGLDRALLFPAIIPAAAEFVVMNPYAFAIATCLDRGTRAEVIWTIPFDLRSRIGNLHPEILYRMTREELTDVLRSLPRKPRYITDAGRTIEDLTRIVVEECDGDTSAIWIGRSASEVKQTLTRVYGVGPGISSMAVLLIEKAFGTRFPDLDHASMDIKADVHTVRVLYRLGVSPGNSERDAIETARVMNPPYPGVLDAPLWIIGRQWCDAVCPKCSECPLSSLCLRRDLG